MYHPHSSAGQPAGPLRPAAPAPVLAAAKLMYGGAAVSAAYLFATLPFMGGIHGKVLGHRLTATPLTITVVIVVFGLVPVALWLWMARKTGQGRNWARGLSMGLFVLSAQHPVFGALATEHPVFGVLGTAGIREGLVPVVFGPIIPVLTWLVGLGAVFLLWRQESGAFFKPQEFR